MENEKKMDKINEEALEGVSGGKGSCDAYIEEGYKDYPCTKTDSDDGCKGCLCLKVVPREVYHELFCTCRKYGYFFWV